MKVKKICKECGSDSVVVDAWSSWDEKLQEWTLESTFDKACCDNCGGETIIIDKEIKDQD